MRAAVLSLLLAGCIAEAQLGYVPAGYEYCESGRRYDAGCEQYYVWVDPSYTVYGYWHTGHWQVRPGYRHRPPAPARDHRR